MANSTIKITPNTTSDEEWMSYSKSECIPWLVLLIVECLAIVILNGVSAAVLLKKHQLQRRGTCLIIHLAIVDLLVGAVAGPVFINRVGAFCDLWEDTVWSKKYSWMNYFTIALGQSLPNLSLLNLAVISLERVHATFFPFKYHVVKKWVYGVIVGVTWLISVTAAILGKDIGTKGRHIMYFSFFAVLLFVISVSYISIFVKVRFCHRLPNHGSSSVMDRKLTNTLFMVTLASIFTWLPLIIGRSLSSLNPQLLKNLNRIKIADNLIKFSARRVSWLNIKFLC
ncbi:uncharacterized protein LOC111331729 [Stylophora pistillata]|uniref:uncharacterized protein LOC111331729 n=1 Tax=Stylophora pistillata TaxID=50429 RepID=UPI000C045D5A|nr:uncharacterized protein LOC111331729 [Stylophora pistillata]